MASNQLRIFSNPNTLDVVTINNRLWVLDNSASVEVTNQVANYPVPLGESVPFHYVEVYSTLTDATILSLLSTVITSEEANTLSRLSASKANAKAIPSWATWDVPTAQTWWTNNIDTPIATGKSSLPATLTLETTRTAILTILNIMIPMSTMLWALARMVIAMRNKIWPDLPQT